MALIVSLPIGTPPQTQQMVLDTGSQLSWIQCHNKTPKKPPPTTAFDPSLSSSFSVLPCTHPLCKLESPILPFLPLVTRTVYATILTSTLTDASDDKGILGMNLGRRSLLPKLKYPNSQIVCQHVKLGPGCRQLGHFTWEKIQIRVGFNTLAFDFTQSQTRSPNLDPFAYTVPMQGIRIGNTRLNIPVSAFRPDPSGSGQT
ncbi:hypothetical protein GH714_014091 [Hevea brasiliensis]|uniref:Peptidase A1 domain-containing protein n=1 Tax=Hevea brasiliensis TaxID=3981 RepID=A0A6A6KNG3_HEVBR|nr:hypothetical protein GH714_014091 [Hevea brasiliensis]